MSAQFSPHDYERISEYLDGRLSGQDMLRMEARMQSDPALRHEVESLRNARRILRSVPMHRAPRNFTLSAKMVGQKPRRSFMVPAFSWASALATVCFIVTLGLNNLSLPGAAAPMAAAPVSEEAYSMQAADAAAESGEALTASEPAATEAAPLIFWNSAQPPSAGLGGVRGVGGGGGGDGSDLIMNATPEGDSAMLTAEFPAEENAVAPEAFTFVENTPAAENPFAPADAMADTSRSMETPTPEPTESSAETVEEFMTETSTEEPLAEQPPAGAMVYSSDITTNGPILGVAPTEERGYKIVEIEQPTPEPMQAKQPVRSTSAALILEIFYGVAAVACALTAFLLHRRNR